jgi:hypothetical protein
MKFAIVDLLWTTAAAAMLVTLLRTSVDGFVVAFGILNLVQVLLPFGILFATIAFAEQRGQMLDISTLPAWPTLKKVWCLSVACTIIVWMLLFLGSG